jgi:hypothetical protein
MNSVEFGALTQLAETRASGIDYRSDFYMLAP